jgi:hypothetical protein
MENGTGSWGGTPTMGRDRKFQIFAGREEKFETVYPRDDCDIVPKL